MGALWYGGTLYQRQVWREAKVGCGVPEQPPPHGPSSPYYIPQQPLSDPLLSFTDAHRVCPPLRRFPAPSCALPGRPPQVPPGLPGPPRYPLADAGRTAPWPPTHCWLELFQYTACRFPSAPPGPWASSGSSGTGTSSSSRSSGAAAIPGAAAAAAPRLSPALPDSRFPAPCCRRRRPPIPRPRPQPFPPPCRARLRSPAPGALPPRPRPAGARSARRVGGRGSATVSPTARAAYLSLLGLICCRWSWVFSCPVWSSQGKD